jgi:hypothetical protein
MDTPEKKSALETFLENTLAQNKNKLNLDKKSTLEITNNIVKEVKIRLSILVAFILFLVIISIAFGYWITEKLGNPYYGFYIISAFYLLTTLILSLVLHRWIDKSLMQVVITKLLK